ncbi:unnamed protein product [Phytophthora fragariaefolia]|uniref:Unnamed protein product n=1 Tax=Phytophthora fragariaefolia TaxID=1490495 RepID=A0A9W6X3D3_9STRA|nr:unnamed protein product [Phytophthora fragariaefolia]
MGAAAAFAHESSAALDAALALSDSEDADASFGGFEPAAAALLGALDADEHAAGGERPRAGAGSSAGTDLGALPEAGGLDPAVSSAIDRELESSEDEVDGDTQRTGAAASMSRVATAGDRAGTGSGCAGTAKGGGIAPLSGLDPAISSAIDDDLATSSDDEGGDDDAETRADENEAEQTGSAGEHIADPPHSKKATVSIDDELDDELAALDSDSEPELREKIASSGQKDDAESSSSSGSSDSGSSDSSDSDSDGDADGPMTGWPDTNEVSRTLGGPGTEESTNPPENNGLAARPCAAVATQVSTSELGAAPVQQPERDDERGASSSSVIDKVAVVLTTQDKKKYVTAAEEIYSPIMEAKLQPKSPERLELYDNAETNNHKETTSIIAASHQSPAQEHATDDLELTKKTPSNSVTTTAEVTVESDAQPSLPDAQSSSTLPSKKPALVASSCILNASTDQEGGSAKVTSSILSLESAARTRVDPVKPVEQEVSQTNPTLSESIPLEVISPTKGGIIGRARKAEEASLGSAHAVAQKKIKKDGNRDEVEGQHLKVSTAAGNKTPMEKAVARPETKEELQTKKSFAAFTKAIALSKGEEADKDYARRTIAVLVNQSSKFVEAHLTHVILADSYRRLGISPMEVLRGVIGVFWTPRSRRLLQDKKPGLCWLCNELLLKLMRSGDQASASYGSLSSPSLEECLQHLRGLLVEERTNIGDSMSSSKHQVQIATRKTSVSHDKVVLAHICALHTHLCQSTGQIARSRVLLFDLLRDNPNIRGLYFAAVAVEIYPAMLERNFDQHCVERQEVLKETILQALVAITCVAAEREELLLHQSSHTMLHRIADALQMPELHEVNGADPSFSSAWVQKLFCKLSAACQPYNPEKEVTAVTTSEFYELAKSLEICTSVFGLDVVAQIFSLEKCQELYLSASVEAKCGIISVVSHFVMAVARKTSDTQNPRTLSELHVESVFDWLHDILSAGTNVDKTSTDGHFKLLAKCSAACVELMLEYSAVAGLDTRRRLLCKVIHWFEAASTDQLISLPASFLRRLRLAVVAARPQVAQTAV